MHLVITLMAEAMEANTGCKLCSGSACSRGWLWHSPPPTEGLSAVTYLRSIPYCSEDSIGTEEAPTSVVKT